MANTRVAYFLIATLVFFAAVACYALAVDLVKYKIYEYPDLAGPTERTLVAPHAPTPWKAYESGSPSRLAVPLTDPDSSWLGLAHALKSFGVPFRVTTDVSEALRHKVVLVYPTVSGRVLSGPELKAIAAYPRRGGHLIGVNVLGGGLNEVFGFAEATESRSRFLMKFDPTTSPVLSEFSHEMEQTISLGNPRKHGEIVGTLGYSRPHEEPLAVYEDGSAAITWRSYGDGRAYAFGFDIGDFFFRAHSARHYAAHRSYVNAFEPTADVVARLIRNIYLQGNPDAVLLGTVPEGRRLSVMFTYDIDTDSSTSTWWPMRNCCVRPVYAALSVFRPNTFGTSTMPSCSTPLRFGNCRRWHGSAWRSPATRWLIPTNSRPFRSGGGTKATRTIDRSFSIAKQRVAGRFWANCA